MEGTKNPLMSKGFWGSLIATGAGVAGLFGVYVPPDVVQTTPELIMEGLATVGGLLSMWGRISATKRIGF